MTRRLSRRSFLARAGASAAALPFVRAWAASAQDAAPPPPRLIVFFTPNGTLHDAWASGDADGQLVLGPILAPLAPFRDRLLALSGLDMQQGGPGDGHQQGMGWLLTGRPLLAGRSAGNCARCTPASWASGASLDQVVAAAIGRDTRLRSLELGNRPGSVAEARTRLCYRGPADPLVPDDDPGRAFERVFGRGRGESPAARARRLAIGGSVLDHALADLQALGAQATGAQREQLQAHLGHVRELERRLRAPAQLAPGCALPDPDAFATAQLYDYPRTGQQHMDLLAAALGCDATRVASLQWTHAAGNIAFPWLGVHERHHDLSHAGDGNAAAREKLVRINAWYAEQLAYLLSALERVPESEGTLLDHTLVLWCSELGKGNAHSHRSLPFLLAGGLGGRLHTGRHLDFGGRSHTDLLLTIARLFGVELESFGEAGLGRGVLSELLVS
jgi:hypothetical protein